MIKNMMWIWNKVYTLYRKGIGNNKNSSEINLDYQNNVVLKSHTSGVYESKEYKEREQEDLQDLDSSLEERSDINTKEEYVNSAITGQEEISAQEEFHDEHLNTEEENMYVLSDKQRKVQEIKENLDICNNFLLRKGGNDFDGMQDKLRHSKEELTKLREEYTREDPELQDIFTYFNNTANQWSKKADSILSRIERKSTREGAIDHRLYTIQEDSLAEAEEEEFYMTELPSIEGNNEVEKCLAKDDKILEIVDMINQESIGIIDNAQKIDDIKSEVYNGMNSNDQQMSM